MAAVTLQRFHPEIAKFIDVVVKNGEFGICGDLPKVTDPKTR